MSWLSSDDATLSLSRLDHQLPWKDSARLVVLFLCLDTIDVVAVFVDIRSIILGSRRVLATTIAVTILTHIDYRTYTLDLKSYSQVRSWLQFLPQEVISHDPVGRIAINQEPGPLGYGSVQQQCRWRTSLRDHT